MLFYAFYLSLDQKDFTRIFWSSLKDFTRKLGKKEQNRYSHIAILKEDSKDFICK